MRVLGAVLAGGASSRFGTDKALAVWRGRTLIDHATATLAGMVDAVVVGGRGGVADLPRPGLGPLGGIAGALDHAERRGFDSVLTVACDMVRLPAGLVEALLARAPSYCVDAPVLGHWPIGLTAALLERLAASSTSSRPCAGIHRAAGAPALASADTWIPAQDRDDGAREESARHARDPAFSVRRWAADIGAVAISSPFPIANVNTPADLAAL